MAAGLECYVGGRAGDCAKPGGLDHLRAGQLLDHRVTFHMVRMRVARNQNLDVGETEAKLLDAFLNLRRR